ncbi:MAG: DUF4397 domain-containing protein [Actinomycetota bacterium]
MSRVRIALAAFVALSISLLAFSSPVAAQDARIHLIHGIPDTDVDVEANGDNVFEGFQFGDTQDLSSLAGATLSGVKVKLAGTDTVAIDAGDVALPSSGNITAIAHLDADGTPTLSIFSNDTSNTAAGEGRLIVRHTAAAPAVDIKANGDVAFANVSNGEEGKADLPTGTISAEVVPTGADDPVVIGPADLPIAEGEALVVYAVGSLDDGNLTVLTESITGLHTNPNQVNTGNSPVSSGLNVAALVAALGAVVVVFGGSQALARRNG